MNNEIVSPLEGGYPDDNAENGYAYEYDTEGGYSGDDLEDGYTGDDLEEGYSDDDLERGYANEYDVEDGNFDEDDDFDGDYSDDDDFEGDYSEESPYISSLAGDLFSDGEVTDGDIADGAGIWRLNDDGTFELLEPYRTKLIEARVVATKAWTEALVGYLEENSPYSAEVLAEELIRRNEERDEHKITIFEEFVLEALSGEL